MVSRNPREFSNQLGKEKLDKKVCKTKEVKGVMCEAYICARLFTYSINLSIFNYFAPAPACFVRNNRS